MGAEEDGAPHKVQPELSPPELDWPAGPIPLPDAPAGDSDEHVEHSPDRAEQPSRRIEGGLAEARIPSAGRGHDADC